MSKLTYNSIRGIAIKYVYLSVQKLKAVGLKPQKKMELYTKWRQIVPQEYKDITCTLPSEDVVKQFRKGIILKLQSEVFEQEVIELEQLAHTNDQKLLVQEEESDLNENPNNTEIDEASIHEINEHENVDNDKETKELPLLKQIVTENAVLPDNSPSRKTYTGNKRLKVSLSFKKKPKSKLITEVIDDSEDDEYLPPNIPLINFETTSIHGDQDGYQLLNGAVDTVNAETNGINIDNDVPMAKNITKPITHGLGKTYLPKNQHEGKKVG